MYLRASLVQYDNKTSKQALVLVCVCVRLVLWWCWLNDFAYFVAHTAQHTAPCEANKQNNYPFFLLSSHSLLSFIHLTRMRVLNTRIFAKLSVLSCSLNVNDSIWMFFNLFKWQAHACAPMCDALTLSVDVYSTKANIQQNSCCRLHKPIVCFCLYDLIVELAEKWMSWAWKPLLINQYSSNKYSEWQPLFSVPETGQIVIEKSTHTIFI